MNPRKFALFGGLIMLLIGIFALMPAFSEMEIVGLKPLDIESSYGMFLMTFPMNIVNKLVLILIGGLGIRCATDSTRGLSLSVKWSRGVCYLFGAFAILGIITPSNTLFGLAPLHGANIALHALYAILGAIFGYSLTAKAARNAEIRTPKAA